MLTVKRDNSQATICIETDLAFSCDGKSTTTLPFTWSTSHPYIADLVTLYVRTQIEKAISDTRREYYEKGWKDAKSKKQKDDWFSGVL